MELAFSVPPNFSSSTASAVLIPSAHPCRNAATCSKLTAWPSRRKPKRNTAATVSPWRREERSREVYELPVKELPVKDLPVE